MIIRTLVYIFTPKHSSWQPPTMRDPSAESAERKATWLELFFDISFVAVIAELSGLLSHEMSFKGLLAYALFYAPIWWLWIGMTFYNDRFDRGTRADRLYAFAMMIPVAGLAISIHKGIAVYPSSFVVWYIIGRALLTFLWARAGIYNPPARPMAKQYVAGFSLAIIFWVTSLYSTGLMQLALWLAALLVEFITPLFTVRFQQQNLPSLNHSHLTERFGLFTIIVLAEIFLGVVHGVGAIEVPTLTTMTLGLLGVLLSFGLWSIYFDDVISHTRMPRPPWNIIWVYMHLPLTMSITAIGSVLVYIISHSAEGLTAFSRFALCSSVALALVSIASIEYAHTKGVSHKHHDHADKICVTMRIIGAIAAMLIAIFFTQTSAVSVLALLVTIIILQVWHSMHVRS